MRKYRDKIEAISKIEFWFKVVAGPFFFTGGIPEYFEDLKRGTNKNIEPKGIFEMVSEQSQRSMNANVSGVSTVSAVSDRNFHLPDGSVHRKFFKRLYLPPAGLQVDCSSPFHVPELRYPDRLV